MELIPPGLVERFMKVWNKQYQNYHPIDTPDRINYGWCYQFAMVLKLIHGNKAKLHSDHGHCWVEIDGIHFDSEYPKMGTFIHPGQSKEMSVDETVDYWKHGGSGSVDWALAKEVASLYMPATPTIETHGSVWGHIKSIFSVKEAA